MTETQRRSPAEIEQDIRVTRSRIDQTLDALQRKLSPRELVDQVFDYARDGGSVFASNVGTMAVNAGRAVRDNPLPVALLCAGLAWLMIGGRRDGRAYRQYYEEDRESGDESEGVVARAAGNAGESVERTVEQIAERVRAAGRKLTDGGAHARKGAGETIGEARHKVAEMGEAAAGTLSKTGERMRESSRHVRERARRTADEAMRYTQEHPLVVGAIMVAAGAAIAAMLPRTRAEDRLMGETSDRLKQGAEDVAGQVVGKAGDAAAAAAGAFKSEAEQRGWTAERAEREAGDLAEAGSEAAKAALRAARDELAQGRGGTPDPISREPHTH